MPQPEQEPPPENQPPSLYLQAARFRSERKAERAYFRAQEALYKAPECDLSAYRFLLDRISHVAVLGAPPAEELDRAIRRILAAGEPTALPGEVLTLLLQRRAEQIRLGPWVERHVRPGQPL
jgi:hypothetical protein